MLREKLFPNLPKWGHFAGRGWVKLNFDRLEFSTASMAAFVRNLRLERIYWNLGFMLLKAYLNYCICVVGKVSVVSLRYCLLNEVIWVTGKISGDVGFNSVQFYKLTSRNARSKIFSFLHHQLSEHLQHALAFLLLIDYVIKKLFNFHHDGKKCTWHV